MNVKKNFRFRNKCKNYKIEIRLIRRSVQWVDWHSVLCAYKGLNQFRNSESVFIRCSNELPFVYMQNHVHLNEWTGGVNAFNWMSELCVCCNKMNRSFNWNNHVMRTCQSILKHYVITTHQKQTREPTFDGCYVSTMNLCFYDDWNGLRPMYCNGFCVSMSTTLIVSME